LAKVKYLIIIGDKMEVLVFEIFAPFGHFRIPYTTTSPLTYSIPPKTAVAGMVGGIIGLDKKDYLKCFNNDNFKIAIQILNPIKMIHINENFLNVKSIKFFARWKKNSNPRTQINVEFLKEPKYRIYFFHSDENIYSELKKRLSAHQSYYTLCMGLSECLANYNYLGEFEIKNEKLDKETEINSVVPLSILNKDSLILFKENEPRKYIKVHIPIALNKNRELSKTEEILIEREGKSIFLKNLENSEIFSCELGNIILF